jgi:hypothetical protein
MPRIESPREERERIELLEKERIASLTDEEREAEIELLKKTHTYPNGDEYVGEFKGDRKYGLRHGQGTMTYAKGGQYVGEFRDGLANGQGTMTFSDGSQYVGEWKEYGSETDWMPKDKIQGAENEDGPIGTIVAILIIIILIGIDFVL